MIVEALGRWLKALARLTPGLLTLLLGLMTTVPLSMSGDTSVVPFLTLMAVFYWTIYRPDLLPAWAVFSIGLVQDLLDGTLVGLTAFLLLIVHKLVLNNRRAFLGKPFGLAWIGFMVTAALVLLAGWLAHSIAFGHLLTLEEPALRLLTSVALFPLLVWFFVRTHRSLLPQDGGAG